MYLIASFMAGLCAKLYDDLTDNPLLTQLSSPLILEYLKGVHYILFTILSLQEPMFWFIIYVANVIHFVINPSSYELPYEKSLLYSALLFFCFIKTFRVDFSAIDYLFICGFILGVSLEPLITPKEYSLLKLCSRTTLTWGCLFCTLFSSSTIIKFIFLYWAGYFGCSSIVQFYSLYKDKFNFNQLLYTKWDDLLI